MNSITNLLLKTSNRWLYLAGVLVIAGLFAVALYIQYALHEEPCPLCMVQRFIFIVLGVLFAIAMLHNPKRIGSRVYAVLIGLFALFGVGVASRHIWIQHLPADQVPACGPGLNYMLDNFPMSQVLKELMHGSGECAHQSTFLALSIPEWSLIWYALLSIWAVMIAIKSSRA